MIARGAFDGASPFSCKRDGQGDAAKEIHAKDCPYGRSPTHAHAQPHTHTCTYMHIRWGAHARAHTHIHTQTCIRPSRARLRTPTRNAIGQPAHGHGNMLASRRANLLRGGYALSFLNAPLPLPAPRWKNEGFHTSAIVSANPSGGINVTISFWLVSYQLLLKTIGS